MQRGSVSADGNDGAFPRANSGGLYRVQIKFINFGLTFSIESIDIAGLAHFAKRSGNLVVTEITAIPDDKATGNGGDEGDDE